MAEALGTGVLAVCWSHGCCGCDADELGSTNAFPDLGMSFISLRKGKTIPVSKWEMECEGRWWTYLNRGGSFNRNQLDLNHCRCNEWLEPSARSSLIFCINFWNVWVSLLWLRLICTFSASTKFSWILLMALISYIWGRSEGFVMSKKWLIKLHTFFVWRLKQTA